jgi:hypothetical protein
LIDNAPLTSHELSSDGRESQPVHDRRREERQRSQRHAVADVSQIVREHPWAEQGLHYFAPRGVFVGISTSFDLDASLDELLVILGKEFGAGWVVGQEEEGQQGTEYRDETFNDKLEMSSTCQLLFNHTMRESELTNQRNPSRPAAPFKWPTPSARPSQQNPQVVMTELKRFLLHAIHPPKAPAAVADASTKAIRTDRSSTGYQKVMR